MCAWRRRSRLVPRRRQRAFLVSSNGVASAAYVESPQPPSGVLCCSIWIRRVRCGDSAELSSPCPAGGAWPGARHSAAVPSAFPPGVSAWPARRAPLQALAAASTPREARAASRRRTASSAWRACRRVSERRPLGSGSTRTPAFGCVGRSRSAVPPPQLQSSALVLFLAARTQRKPRTPNVPPAAAGRRLPTEAAETCCKSCRQCGLPVCS